MLSREARGEASVLSNSIKIKFKKQAKLTILVQAAVTVWHRWGDLKTTEISFSWFRKSRSGCQHGQALVEDPLLGCRHFYTEWPYDPAIPLPGMCPKRLKTGVTTKTRMSIAALFTVAKSWDRTSWWVDKQNVVHPYNRALVHHKKKEVLICARMCQNVAELENIMLSQRSHTKKDIYGIIPFIWNI